MTKLQDKYVEVGLRLLYIKACKEQVTKDARVVSPRMKEIQDLKDWYFKGATPK